MDKCPQCGFSESISTEKRNTVMHPYITSDGKKQAVMNRSEEKFDAVKGEGKDAVTTTWIRKDVYDAKAKSPAPTNLAPKPAETPKASVWPVNTSAPQETGNSATPTE